MLDVVGEGPKGWTDARIELLEKLWGDGYPTSKIATTINKETGGHISRNAVIGKVHRLGLPGRKPATSLAAPREAMGPAWTRKGWAASTTAIALFKDDFTPDEEVEAFKTPTPRATARGEAAGAAGIEMRLVRLVDLKSGLCHWPLGDPKTKGFRYCGADADPRRSYCPAHHRLAYAPAVAMRKQYPKRPRQPVHLKQVRGADGLGFEL